MILGRTQIQMTGPAVHEWTKYWSRMIKRFDRCIDYTPMDALGKLIIWIWKN